MSKEHKNRVHPISVEEAKNRLSKVIPILEKIEPVHREYKILSEKLVKISKTEDPQTIAKVRYEVDMVEKQLEQFRKDLLELDCVIKDFNTGLVDFVALKGDEPVWLCFQHGEEDLKYYHSWKGGFAARQEIDFS